MAATGIDLNQTACIVKNSNFGETIITNICSGAVFHVPWGTLDWVSTFLLLGVAVGVACVIGAGIIAFIKYPP